MWWRPCEKLVLEWESTRHCSFCVHCTSTQLIWGQNDRRPTIASCRRKVLFSTSELFCAACARRVVKVGRWRSHIALCSSRLVERVWRRKWNDVNTHTHLTPGGIFTSFNFFPPSFLYSIHVHSNFYISSFCSRFFFSAHFSLFFSAALGCCEKPQRRMNGDKKRIDKGWAKPFFGCRLELLRSTPGWVCYVQS